MSVLIAKTAIRSNTVIEFRYADSRVVFALHENILMSTDVDDATAVIFKDADVLVSLERYGISGDAFIADFYNKGLKLDTAIGPVDLKAPVVPERANGLYISISAGKAFSEGKRSFAETLAERALDNFKLTNEQREVAVGAPVYIHDSATGRVVGAFISSMVEDEEKKGRFTIGFESYEEIKEAPTMTFAKGWETYTKVKSLYIPVM